MIKAPCSQIDWGKNPTVLKNVESQFEIIFLYFFALHMQNVRIKVGNVKKENKDTMRLFGRLKHRVQG